MKTILIHLLGESGLHLHFERHFGLVTAFRCPSSTLWKTSRISFRFQLSFIQPMKDISKYFPLSDVLHLPYERHLESVFVFSCPSFPLWKTFRNRFRFKMSFIPLTYHLYAPILSNRPKKTPAGITYYPHWWLPCHIFLLIEWSLDLSINCMNHYADAHL